MSCKLGSRHDDNSGVDCEITYRGATNHAWKTQVQINVQLKATIQSPGNLPDHHSFRLKGISRYERLRKKESEIAKVLVVLFLPKNPAEWISCSSEELVMKNAAYWVNIYAASQTVNSEGITIYLPKANLFSPEGLENLKDFALFDQFPPYQVPRT